MKHLIQILVLVYLVSISSLFSHSYKKKTLSSHEHGVGILNIAQDGDNLIFEFEAPGADIVGFEYESKEEEDITKVKNALDILSNYKNIISPASSADCKLESSSAKVINEGTHSEFLSNYKFNCKDIKNLKIIKIFGSNKKSAYVINKSKRMLNVKGHF